MTISQGIQARNGSSDVRGDSLLRQETVRPLTVPPLSSLAVVPLADVLLHEEHDATRAEPLQHVIAQEGIQRHPVVLARDHTGPLFHLDGANRITALRRLGCPHVAAQVVDYAEPAAVSLGTWLHLTRIDRTALLTAAHAWPTCTVERLDPVQAPTLLTQEQVVALVVFAHGEVFGLRSGMGVADRVAAMRQLTALYAAPPRRETLLGADVLSGLQALLTRTPQANAGVVFAPLRKADVITLVWNLRLQLPAGITRHVITCGRILHVNMPLTLLQADLSTEEKAIQLQALLASRRCRIYLEPTMQFESY